jgi:chaperone required for assembly of F1-ATPase
MRDLFEEMTPIEPLDPTEAARRGIRPRVRRRFYQHAEVVEGVEGNFGISLDGRPVRTPAGRALAAPSRKLAEAIAAEWDAQGDLIDPAAMPLTRLANTVIDGVVEQPAAVAAEVEKYLSSDLVLYRADGPDRLVAKQAAAWDPILAFARDTLGAKFLVATGMVFVTQPREAIAAAASAIPRGPGRAAWRLGALHSMTTLTGSALIALAFAGGALSLEDAWSAAHVDEDWNMDLWGRDLLALDRRAYRFAEMQAAARLLQMV